MLPFSDHRWFAALSVIVAVALVGCSRAPEASRATAAKPAAPAGHDDDHDHDDGHEHGHDHDHDKDHAEHKDHDDEHPETLSAGVARLVTLAASVKDHLATESRDDADAAVHDMGHLLEDLHGLVRTSDLAADAKSAATKALDELFECFNALDESLHAEPGQGTPPAEVHASVADRIKAAIGALESASAAKAAAVEDETRRDEK